MLVLTSSFVLLLESTRIYLYGTYIRQIYQQIIFNKWGSDGEGY